MVPMSGVDPAIGQWPNSTIAILTWSNRADRFQPVPEVMRSYCRRHGYDRIISSFRRTNLLPPWEKLALLQELLPRYRAVLLVDDDAVIAKHDITVSSLLEQYPRADILLSIVERRKKAKWWKWYLSPITGVVLVRNTKYTREFLVRALKGPGCAESRRREDCCWEQDCVWSLMEQDGVYVHLTHGWNATLAWSGGAVPGLSTGKFGILRGRSFDCRDTDVAGGAEMHTGTCGATLPALARPCSLALHARSLIDTLVPPNVSPDRGRLACRSVRLPRDGPAQGWVRQCQGEGGVEAAAAATEAI